MGLTNLALGQTPSAASTGSGNYDLRWAVKIPMPDGVKLNATALSAKGERDSDAQHFLVIGPWDHPGTRTPTDEVEGIKSGSAALLDLNHLHRQWDDWTMRKGAKPAFLKKQVAYYVLAGGNTGANGEWRYADSLAALTAQTRPFYLDSKQGDANGVFHSGTLSETRPSGGADKFTYDPLDTRRGEAFAAPGAESGIVCRSKADEGQPPADRRFRG